MPVAHASRRIAPAFGASLALSLSGVAFARPAAPGTLDVKRGQEATFAVTIADGKATPGPPALSKPGTAQPKDGEIKVGVIMHGLSPYAELSVTEKTPVPVDFVATGLVGDVKIDEVVVCGRLDAPVTTRIASGAWRVSLNRFIVHPDGGASPPTGQGDLGCPK